MTENPQIKPFLRILNVDLDGNKPLGLALRKIHGVSFSMSNAVCNLLKLDKKEKAGLVKDETAKKIENVLKTSEGLPKWMINRRADVITGDDAHLTGPDLKFVVDNDVKRMRRLKTYRGARHSAGQPSRGQRTRAHFRHGKSVGVQKTKVGASATKRAK